MIFFRAFVAIGMVVLAFAIYPSYVEYFITPVAAIATSLNPDMNLFETMYIQMLPLVLLLLILFFGIMKLLGKGKGSVE